MKITVIIPTKNRNTDLIVAIKSILRQTTIPDELVIVDQSDTEKSKIEVSALASWGNKLPTLRYIYDQSISGLVHAKQVGVSNSSGDIVCFLEDDIELETDYIASMKDVFNNHKSIQGCCGVVTNLPKLASGYKHFFHLFHRGIFFDQRVGIYGATNDRESLIPSRFLSGGTSAFRNEVFNAINFDVKNNFHMLEDIDFSIRAWKHFGNVFFINTKARLAHYMSPLNRARYQIRYRRKLREFIVFYKKNRRGFKDAIALTWLLIGLLIESIIVATSKGNIGIIKGFFEGIYDGYYWEIKK